MTDVTLQWARADDVGCRTKLEARGIGWAHAALAQPTAIVGPRGRLFSPFVNEGSYAYHVECRQAGANGSKSITVRWEMFWEFPKSGDERMNVDWPAANRTSRHVDARARLVEIS